MYCHQCGRACGEASGGVCEACAGDLIDSCARCGAANERGHAFCRACGGKLRAVVERPLGEFGPRAYTPQHLADKIFKLRAAVEGERKPVTVLFCDLANSMELAEELGPEAMHRLLNRFFELGLEAVHRYEGTVNQFLGDGFMALFGAPIGHEDHAARGALAALDLRRALSDAEPTLKLRMGINTGPVVVGQIGDNLRMDYTAVGDTTNVAARLQQAAEPGTILIGRATAKALDHRFRREEVPELHIKGKNEPVAASKLIAVSSSPSPRATLAPAPERPFLGRKQELEALLARFADVRAGRGQVVAISGDAGIGKSRLLDELRQAVGEGAMSYLEGRCLSYSAGIPYLPIVDLLRSTAGVDGEDPPPVVAAKLERAVTEVGMDRDGAVPYLLQLLGIEEGTANIAITPEAIKARTAEVLIDLWVRRSRRKPLLLCVEDVHWIDRSSDELLQLLSSRVANEAILLVIIFRSGNVPAWIDAPGVSRLNLSPLSSETSVAIASALLGPPRADGLAEAIAARAEGNPFFIEELIRNVAHTNGDKGAPLPSRVQDVLIARLDRLPEDAKRLLQTAAVLGREAPVALLQRTWDGGGSITELLGVLRRFEFVEARADQTEATVSFKHALTQEVVYGTLLGGRLGLLHGRAAEALEAIYEGRLDEQCELLAHHYGLGGNAAKALEYLARAARKAARANNVIESSRYYFDAVKVLDGLPNTNERRRERASLLLDEAIVFFLMLDFQTYHRLLKEHEGLLLDLGDDRLLGRYYTRLGHFEWVPGQFHVSLELARKGATLCERTEDWENAAYARMLVQWNLLFLGRYEESIGGEVDVRRALGKGFDLRWYVWSLSASAFAHMWQGRWTIAIDKARNAVDAALRLSDDSMSSFAALVLAIVYRYQGDLDQALTLAEFATQKAPTPTDKLLSHSGLAWVKCHRGEGNAPLDALKQLVGAMQHLNFRSNFYTLLLGEALVVSGARDEAAAVLNALIDSARRVEMRLELGPALRLKAELLLDQREHLADAEALLHESIALVTEMGADDALARAWLALGRLRSGQGRHDEARQLWTKALSTFERLGSLREPERVRRLIATLPVSGSAGGAATSAEV